MMELLIVVSTNVAAGENLFQVAGEVGVDRHYVFEVPVSRTILHHQNPAVALNNLGLDLPRFFVHQNFNRQFAVENLLTDFRNALGAE